MDNPTLLIGLLWAPVGSATCRVTLKPSSLGLPGRAAPEPGQHRAEGESSKHQVDLSPAIVFNWNIKLELYVRIGRKKFQQTFDDFGIL